MANAYQIIDEKTWKRAMHCMVFRNSVEPALREERECDTSVRLGQIPGTGWKNCYAGFRTGTSFVRGRHTYRSVCGRAAAVYGSFLEVGGTAILA